MTETTQPDIDLAETFALAADLEDRSARLEHWLTTEVEPEWSAFVAEMQTVHGVRLSEFSSSMYGGWYEMRLTSRGAHFTGSYTFFGETEDHEYTIPADFIDPATRHRALSRIRQAFQTEQARVAARADEQARDEAAKKRATDEAEYERLRIALGKTD